MKLVHYIIRSIVFNSSDCYIRILYFVLIYNQPTGSVKSPVPRCRDTKPRALPGLG